MPTSKTEGAALKQAQAMYAALPDRTRNALPEPTLENVKEFQAALFNDEGRYNDFLHVVEKIGMSLFRSFESKNQLALLKKGKMELGSKIEEVFADKIGVTDWNFGSGGDFEELFGQSQPNVYSCFHSINFNKVVKRSIPDTIIRRGVFTWSALMDVIGDMLKVVYESMVDEEAQAMEDLLKLAHEGGFAFPVKVPAFDVTTCTKEDLERALIAEVSAVKRMGVRASRNYNNYGVSTITPVERVVFITTPEYAGALRVLVNAAAFNIGEVELMGRVVEVSSLGEAETHGTVGWLVDEDFFQVWEVDRRMTVQYNSYTRTWVYHYFLDGIFSLSMFSNAIELTSNLATIGSVTVAPGQNAKKGVGTDIKADIVRSGQGAWTSRMDWSIEGQLSKKTYISPHGTLFVAPDETAETINVTAKSSMNPSQTSTQAVTII